MHARGRPGPSRPGLIVDGDGLGTEEAEPARGGAPPPRPSSPRSGVCVRTAVLGAQGDRAMEVPRDVVPSVTTLSKPQGPCSEAAGFRGVTASRVPAVLPGWGVGCGLHSAIPSKPVAGGRAGPTSASRSCVPARLSREQATWWLPRWPRACRVHLSGSLPLPHTSLFLPQQLTVTAGPELTLGPLSLPVTFVSADPTLRFSNRERGGDPLQNAVTSTSLGSSLSGTCHQQMPRNRETAAKPRPPRGAFVSTPSALWSLSCASTPAARP